jgi:nitroimidazol reductase NimA-like FMN-containing flavoprotein (pyridoxamine 5'-phosphate oxidase superfamily)
MELDQSRRLFRDIPTVHLGTTGPDGWSHVVPLWFVWLEDAVYASSRRGSHACRNLERDPRATMQFDRGRAWTELSGLLVRGRGEVLSTEEPSAKVAMSAWFEKYRGELTGTQFGVYVEQVPEPVLVRVVPDRVTGWAHANAWIRGG